jgi:hypothetical protein
MESLQIQDSFTPYYSGRSSTQDENASRAAKGSDERTTTSGDVRTRLLACRNRLARTIAATSEKR